MVALGMGVAVRETRGMIENLGDGLLRRQGQVL